MISVFLEFSKKHVLLYQSICAFAQQRTKLYEFINEVYNNISQESTFQRERGADVPLFDSVHFIAHLNY